MTDDKKQFLNWKEVVEDFLNRKKDSEEEKYIKDEIKKIADLYKRKEYFKDQEIKNFFDPKKEKKDKSQTAIDFQRKKLQSVLKLEQIPDEFDVIKISEEYQNKCEKIAEKFEARKWIIEASKNADSVSFATHVIKLTHSKIDSSSFYDQIDSQKLSVLSTASIKEKSIDGAVSGNQYAPIYQFLDRKSVV